MWVADNSQTVDTCFKPAFSEAKSTQCGGDGVTVFYGMAKPVRDDAQFTFSIFTTLPFAC